MRRSGFLYPVPNQSHRVRAAGQDWSPQRWALALQTPRSTLYNCQAGQASKHQKQISETCKRRLRNTAGTVPLLERPHLIDLEISPFTAGIVGVVFFFPSPFDVDGHNRRSEHPAVGWGRDRLPLPSPSALSPGSANPINLPWPASRPRYPGGSMICGDF